MWSSRPIGFNVPMSATDPWAPFDGRINAPVANIQFPHLLDPYGTGSAFAGAPPTGRYRWPTNFVWSTGNLIQPPWKVAGVDYPVGIRRDLYPTNASLKDPSSTSTLGGSIITNAASGTGSSDLFFNTPVPSWLTVGMYAFDTQFNQIPYNATVQSITNIGGSPATTKVSINQSTTNFLGGSTEISFSNYKGIYPFSSSFVVYVFDSNTVMDGWDLSVGNGWGLSVTPAGANLSNVGGTNITIQNCNFSFGSNMSLGGAVNNILAHNGILFSPNDGSIFQYCEIYGNGQTVSCDQTLGSFGGLNAAGTNTIQYIYMDQASGIGIYCGNTFPQSSLIIQYNVLQDSGAGQNAFGFHGDTIQCLPADNTQKLLQISFNLMYQQLDATTTGAANQGFTTNGIGNAGETNSKITSFNIGNNTCVITGNGDMNEFASAGTPQTPSAQVTNNYVAPNAYSLPGGASGSNWTFLNNGTNTGPPAVVSGNVRMDTGATAS